MRRVPDNFLAVFGHVVIDVTMRVDFLPTSGSVGVNSMEDNYGGTAGNFAMVASSLGLPFHLYSAVSSKTHSDYISFLRKRGADTSHLVIDNVRMGPIGYAVTSGDEQIFYFYQGPMEDSLYDRIKPESLDYNYIHFGTGLPDDYLKFAEKAGNSSIVFDPGQELGYRYDKESLSRLIDLSHIVFFNESEEKKAASMLGITREELTSRCENLIVTRGKRGALLRSGGEEHHFASLNVGKPYDTIGAGDTFRAGFYYGLHSGMSMKESMVVGTVTAGYAILSPIRKFSMNGKELVELYNKYRDSIMLK